MFLLIQMLLPQKQEKQPNQPLGVGSYKSHLLLGLASCQPGTAGADIHCSRYGPHLLTLQLRRKTRLRDPPYRAGYSTLWLAEKSTRTLWGWCRPSKSSQWLQWSLRHRHTDTKPVIIFYLGCWWFQMPTLHEPFITTPPLVTPSSHVRGMLMFFHFPFALSSGDREKCYWKYFTAFQGRWIVPAWHSTGQLPPLLCSMKTLPYLCKLIPIFFNAGYSYLIYWLWLWKQKGLFVEKNIQVL